MDALDFLKELGFSDYEAKAYVALTSGGPGNGYEVAKAAAVPRANVYAVLERLIARGAAHRFETPHGTRYAATPSSELLANLDQQYRDTLHAARDALDALTPPAAATPVVNLTGHDELMAQARAVIDGAMATLGVAIHPADAATLADALRGASDRGVAITTLCLEACECECAGCRGDIHRVCMGRGHEPAWLLLVADDAVALVGQAGSDAVQGLVTRQALVVGLVNAYVRQSLALALIGDEFAGRFEGLLSRQANEVLRRLYADQSFPVLVSKRGDAVSSQ